MDSRSPGIVSSQLYIFVTRLRKRVCNTVQEWPREERATAQVGGCVVGCRAYARAVPRGFRRPWRSVMRDIGHVLHRLCRHVALGSTAWSILRTFDFCSCYAARLKWPYLFHKHEVETVPTTKQNSVHRVKGSKPSPCSHLSW